MNIDARVSNKIANMGLVCACLVVGIHLGDTTNVGSATWWFIRMTKSSLCSIAVPFFFMVSGFMLARHCDEDGWWGRAIKKRIVTLLIPFFAWNLIWLMFDYGMIIAANVVTRADLFRNIRWNGVLWALGLDPRCSPPLFTYWYIRSLFLFVLIAPMFTWIVKRSKGWILPFLWLLYAWLLPGDETGGLNGWQMVFKWTFSLLGVFYFSLGIWMRLIISQASLLKGRLVIGWGLIVGMLICAVKTYCVANGIGQMSILRPIAIPILIVGMWMIMPDNKWPKWLVSLAFPIYTLHAFVRTVGWMMLPDVTASTISFLLFWICVVGVCMISAIVFRRTLPRISTFLFGGRA